MDHTVKQATRVANVSDELDDLRPDVLKQVWDDARELYTSIGTISFLEAFEQAIESRHGS